MAASTAAASGGGSWADAVPGSRAAATTRMDRISDAPNGRAALAQKTWRHRPTRPVYAGVRCFRTRPRIRTRSPGTPPGLAECRQSDVSPMRRRHPRSASPAGRSPRAKSPRDARPPAQGRPAFRYNPGRVGACRSPESRGEDRGAIPDRDADSEETAVRSRQRSGRNGLIRNLVAVGLVAGGVATGAGPEKPTPGGDWPTYRHDAALSAVSPLRGGLGRAPRVAWSVDLGGPRIPSEAVLVRDVTGDGRDEILLVGDDAVECRDARGRRLWRLDGYPGPAVVDVRDYAGDGSRGILLTTTAGGRVETFLVDGRSGPPTSLWRD